MSTTMMTREEFGALEKSIRRGIRETKLADGESPPDASTFLEEGELDQVFQLTNALIHDVDLYKSKLVNQECATRDERNNVKRLEAEIVTFKRVHPITIVVLALLQLWGCFLGGATLEWKLAYLREWHFGGWTTAFSGIFALTLIIWACAHSESRWYR